jgi:hypothetical protein
MMYPPASLRAFPTGGPHQRPGQAGTAVSAGLTHSAPDVALESIAAICRPGARRRMHRNLLTSATAILLSACGASNQGNEWFPLRAGEAQTYIASYDTDEPHETDIWTLTAQGPVSVDDQELMMRRHSDGVTYYFKVDDQGIRRVASRMDIDQDPSMDPEPRWVIKAPYTVGTEWTTPTVPYLIQRLNEHPRELKYSHTVPMTWRIEAVDDQVQLAEGSAPLKPCMRLRGEAKLNLYTDSVNGFTDVPLVSQEWYCKDRGLVKFERIEKVPKGFLTGGTLSAQVAP